MKPKPKKLLLITAALLLPILLFLLEFSMLRFPFLFPHHALASHLNSDLGISLPPSATILNAYWVGARDPEEAFALQMSPTDIAPFISQIRAAATTKKFEIKDPAPTFPDLPASLTPPTPTLHPAYGPPPWWNNPALPDPQSFTLLEEQTRWPPEDFGFLYSPSTGRIYIFWGRS